MTKQTEALKMAIEHIEHKGATTELKMVLQACKEALDEEQSSKPTIRSFIEFVIAGTIIFVGMYLMLTTGGGK